MFNKFRLICQRRTHHAEDRETGTHCSACEFVLSSESSQFDNAKRVGSIADRVRAVSRSSLEACRNGHELASRLIEELLLSGLMGPYDSPIGALRNALDELERLKAEVTRSG